MEGSGFDYFLMKNTFCYMKVVYLCVSFVCLSNVFQTSVPVFIARKICCSKVLASFKYSSYTVIMPQTKDTVFVFYSSYKITLCFICRTVVYVAVEVTLKRTVLMMIRLYIK